MHSRRYKKKGEIRKCVHLEDLILCFVRKASNLNFPSIYTHLKSHIAHKNRMVKLIDGSPDPRGTSCGPFSIIIAHPTGLPEYVFDFPVLFVEIKTNPPECQFYWNACEPPKSERDIRNACELLKSKKLFRKQQHKQNSVIYSWNCLFLQTFLVSTPMWKRRRSLFIHCKSKFGQIHPIFGFIGMHVSPRNLKL